MATDTELKQRTAASFGYEWSRFNSMLPEYESNLLSYISPVSETFFIGKTVLDAGCGAGRHSYFISKWGAKSVVAFDLGREAVTAARNNTRDLDNVNAVQADIYNLPYFWDSSFDTVMCLGVLQHLPDPQAGFEKLVHAVKPGGTILIWVYGREDNWLAIHLYEPMRNITTRLPYKVVYGLAWVVAAGVELTNILNLPLFQYYRKFPFETKWNDAFDVLSAPKSRYYTVWEIQKWFKRAGLVNSKVGYRIVCGKSKGIRGMGTKPT